MKRDESLWEWEMGNTWRITVLRSTDRKQLILCLFSIVGFFCVCVFVKYLQQWFLVCVNKSLTAQDNDWKLEKAQWGRFRLDIRNQHCLYLSSVSLNNPMQQEGKFLNLIIFIQKKRKDSRDEVYKMFQID